MLFCVAMGCGHEQGANPPAKTFPHHVLGTNNQAKSFHDDVEGPEISDVLRRAMKAAQDVESAEDKIEILADVAVVQAKTGDRTASIRAFRTALELAGTIKVRMYKVDALEHIAEAQAEAADAKSALTTVALLQATKGLDEVSDPESVYVTIAISQANTGDLDGASHTLESVTDNYWKSCALGQVATVQWKNEDRGAAIRTFQRASATARRATNVYLRTSALASIAEVHASIGHLEAAHILIDEALGTAKTEPDAHMRRAALGSVAEAQAECGDVEGILETVASMKRAGSARNLQVAQSAARSGDLKTAIDYVTSSHLGIMESVILGHIAQAHSKSGDFEAAQKIVSTISEKDWRDIALCEIAIDQVDVGQLAGAVDTCFAIDDNFWKARALSEIALAQTRVGKCQSGFDTVPTVAQSGQRCL
jgi:tetratricopeptide (TPR) repeat protein